MGILAGTAEQAARSHPLPDGCARQLDARTARAVALPGVASKPMDTIEISEIARDGWHVVGVKGRVDGLTADLLERALVTAVGAHPKVAVDCSAIDYIT